MAFSELLTDQHEDIPMILIEVEEMKTETRQKKNGTGTYELQAGYAHLTDRNGEPDRYPQKINLFPPRDGMGNSQPYKVGKYKVAPQSFKVGNAGFLELGFLVLEPAK